MREGWMECELNEIILHTIGGTWGSDPGTREIEVISFGTKAFAGGQEFLDPSSGASRSISSAQYAKRELLAGDIILEVSGGSEDQPVGRTLYVKDDMPHVVPSSFFRLLRFDSRVIAPDYARLLMQWLYLNGTTRLHQSNTTSIRNLKVPEFLAVRVSVPPSVAQRRIVDLMRHVDLYRDCLVAELRASATTQWMRGAEVGSAEFRTTLLTSLLSGRHEIPPSYDDLTTSEGLADV